MQDIKDAARGGRYPRPNLAREVALLRIHAPELPEGDWMWQLEPALAWDAPAVREDVEDLSDDDDDVELARLERGQRDGVVKATSPRFRDDPAGIARALLTDTNAASGGDMKVEELWSDDDRDDSDIRERPENSGTGTGGASGGKGREKVDRKQSGAARRKGRSRSQDGQTGPRRMAGDVEAMVLAGTGDYYLSGSDSENDAMDPMDPNGSDEGSENRGDDDSMGRQLTTMSGLPGGLDDLEAGDTITAAKRRRARRLLRRQGQRDAERKGAIDEAENMPALPRAALM